MTTSVIKQHTVSIFVRFVFVLVVGVLVSCTEPEPEKEIVGQADELVITKEGEFQFQLILNKSPAHMITTSERLWLKNYFGKLGDYKVVLLEEYAGGNICQSFSNRLFIWGADGSYRITDRFGHCGGEPIEVDRDRLILRYKGYKAEHTDKIFPVQVWMYQDGNIEQIE